MAAETQRVTLIKKLDTLVLDAIVTETLTMANEVTDHPVEDGPNISDHSRPKPDALTLDCVVSNAPLNGERGRVTKNGFTFSSSTKGDSTRADKALTALRDLRNKGALFSVICSLGTFESMGIESISIPRDVKNSDGLRFTVQVKRVRVVKNKLTRRTVSRDVRVGGKVTTGSTSTKPTEQESSALFDAAEGAAGSDNGTLKGLGNFLLGGGK